MQLLRNERCAMLRMYDWQTRKMRDDTWIHMVFNRPVCPLLAFLGVFHSIYRSLVWIKAILAIVIQMHWLV